MQVYAKDQVLKSHHCKREERQRLLPTYGHQWRLL